MKFAVYENASGRILRVGNCAAALLGNQAKAGETAVAVADDVKDNTHCWDGGAVAAKTAFGGSWDKTEITADGTDAATLSGLPDPVDLIIDGELVNVTGGQLVFKATTPGDYVIKLDVPALLPQKWVIESV